MFLFLGESDRDDYDGLVVLQGWIQKYRLAVYILLCSCVLPESFEVQVYEVGGALKSLVIFICSLYDFIRIMGWGRQWDLQHSTCVLNRNAFRVLLVS